MFRIQRVKKGKKLECRKTANKRHYLKFVFLLHIGVPVTPEQDTVTLENKYGTHLYLKENVVTLVFHR